MTLLDLPTLQAIRDLLRSGRTTAAAEALDAVITEAMREGLPPDPPTLRELSPLWMRTRS